MNNGPQITVLLAAYNGLPYLEQQLDSILAQTLPVHILISDDGSTDGTKQLLEQYSEWYPEQITLCPRAGHKRVRRTAGGSMSLGPDGAAGNFFWLFAAAFSRREGAYFLPADQDDVWENNKVEILYRKIRSIEKKVGETVPVLVHSDLKVVDENLSPISPGYFSHAGINPRRTSLAGLLVENNVTGSSLIMNRPLLALVQEVPQACFMHDWWLALTASCFGHIGFVPEPLGKYRQHGGNTVGAGPARSAKILQNPRKRQLQVQKNYCRMIDQARAFESMYYERLSEQQRAVLEAFTSLCFLNPAGRIRTVIRFGLKKSSRLQTAAMIFNLPRITARRRTRGFHPPAEKGRQRTAGARPGHDALRLPEGGVRPRLDAVILNYNDAGRTAGLAERLAACRLIRHVIIVDNASTDGSMDRLSRLSSDKIQLVESGRNGGFGFGNNVGVRFARAQNQATHVLIANPDISVGEETVKCLLSLLCRHPDAAAAAPREIVRTAAGGRRRAKRRLPGSAACYPARSAWPLFGVPGELLRMGPVSRRLFAPFLTCPPVRGNAGQNAGAARKASRFGHRRGQLLPEAAEVGVLHGALLMVDAEKFLEAGGYDENMFLYGEEAVLARRLKARGYRSLLLLTHCFMHAGSASISKSVPDALARQRLREESTLYYFKEYLGAGPLTLGFSRCWFKVIRAEIRAAGLLGLL